MSGAVFGGDAGEVLRQASAVVGRPVVLWEVTGAHEAVSRASSDPNATAALPRFDLDGTLRRWKVPIPVGSRWVASPGDTQDSWVVAPVRSRPPAPPPGGRERRSRERLTLELAGLALHSISASSRAAATPSGMIAHQASNPLAAARGGLELAMEYIGRWVDLAADRRLALLDDLGQVLDDIDRTSGFLNAVRSQAASDATRPDRFDAVRVIRSCLTLERRLLRDRGIDLDFKTTLEASYIKGDPNALFDLLVNLVRSAAEAAGVPTPIAVQLEQKGRELELVIRGHGSAASLAKVRAVTKEMFSGTVSVETPSGGGTTFRILLPLPPQREGDRRGG